MRPHLEGTDRQNPIPIRGIGAIPPGDRAVLYNIVDLRTAWPSSACPLPRSVGRTENCGLQIRFGYSKDATYRPVVYVNLGPARASLRLEARRGFVATSSSLRSFGLGRFGPSQRARKVPSGLPQPRDVFRSCPAFRGRDQPRVAVLSDAERIMPALTQFRFSAQFGA